MGKCGRRVAVRNVLPMPNDVSGESFLAGRSGVAPLRGHRKINQTHFQFDG